MEAGIHAKGILLSMGGLLLTDYSCGLQASNPGNVVINIGRQLQDGHWVLSFQSSQAAQRAKQLIDESTEAMFALYQQSLSLL